MVCCVCDPLRVMLSASYAMMRADPQIDKWTTRRVYINISLDAIQNYCIIVLLLRISAFIYISSETIYRVSHK